MPDWLILVLGVAAVAGVAIAGQIKLFGRYSEQLDEQKKIFSGDNGLIKQVIDLTITCTKLESSVSGLQAILSDGLPDRVRLLEISMAQVKERVGGKQ